MEAMSTAEDYYDLRKTYADNGESGTTEPPVKTSNAWGDVV